VALLHPASSRAQTVTATALDRFEPSPAADSLITIPDATVFGQLRPVAGVVLSYANSPLVVRQDDGTGSVAVREVVADHLILHTMLGLEVARRLKVEVDVPLTLLQGAGPEAPPDSSYRLPESDSPMPLNDIRAGARVALLQQRGYFPSAALAFSAWFPTGDETRYTGATGFRYAPAVIVGTSNPGFVWSTTLAGRFQDGGDGLLGSEMLLGAGAAIRFGGRFQVGPEIFGSTVVSGEDGAFSSSTTTFEWLLAARARAGSFLFGVAGGSGLTDGVGSPKFRLLANVAFATEMSPRTATKPRPADAGPGTSGPAVEGISAPATVGSSAPATPGSPIAAGGAPIRDDQWLKARAAEKEVEDWPGWPVVTDDADALPPAPPPDADKDGVSDSEDSCPDKPGLKSGQRRGCPPDADGDGVSDAEDACPSRVGAASSDPKRRGCPPDADGDGIADTDDLCPEESNEKAPDAARYGCVADTDGDGVGDPSDACPDVKGPKDIDPAKNGCSDLIVLNRGENILLKQKIKFSVGGNAISPESFPILTEISVLMTQHPEIARVSVDGHTDNVGALHDNVALSQQRALAVVRWLLDQGIDARRLEARGFGPKQPISKVTAENRRVEFTIRSTTNLGEAGWKEGPVDDQAKPSQPR
jgi:OmpA-OmpF porin, OOP family